MFFKERNGKEPIPGTHPERMSDGEEKSVFETLGLLIDSGGITIDILEHALDNKDVTLAQYRVLNRQLHERKDADKTKVENDLARAHIDGLTSLIRRDYFKPRTDKLLSELYYSKEHRHLPIQSLMVIKLDVNDFKVFNEKPYSHDVGDQALIAIADRFREVTKEGMDVLCRYGGDEFAIVLQIFESDVDFADLFAKKQKAINENLSIKAPNGDVLPITISMGYSVAEKGKEKRSTEQLLKEAENMERRNKEEGNL